MTAIIYNLQNARAQKSVDAGREAIQRPVLRSKNGRYETEWRKALSLVNFYDCLLRLDCCVHSALHMGHEDAAQFRAILKDRLTLLEARQAAALVCLRVRAPTRADLEWKRRQAKNIGYAFGTAMTEAKVMAAIASDEKFLDSNPRRRANRPGKSIV